MDKKEYIKRQISRTNKKDYENYVITRIIHGINDLNVKFITQQYVKRPNGRALADLYFPQINYFIEIDEGHHLSQMEGDKVRDADFEDATGVKPIRIDVATKSIEEINQQIDLVIIEIKSLITEKKQKSQWMDWDLEAEMNPDTWIKKKKIHVNDKVAFKRIVDGCKCMGLNYVGYQRAGANHPFEKNTLIWFPKLYPNGIWENSFDEVNGIIIEKNIESIEKQNAHINSCLNDNRQRRIVFARVKGMLGDVQYRFRGVFELDREKTNKEIGLMWVRVSKEAKTYNYN
jgi:very-short-patch-repair endonuclease